MKTLRTLAGLLTILFFAASALAQSARPTGSLAPVTGLLHATYQVIPTPPGSIFTITELDTNRLDVSDGQEHSINFTIHNISPDSQTVYVNRSQALPAGWNSSICDPFQCHPELDSAILWGIPGNSSAIFTLNLIPSIYDEPDSAAVLLHVGIVGSNSDTVTLPFYGNFVPADPPLIFAWSGTPTFSRTYMGAGSWVLTNVLTNLAGMPVKYALSIEDSLPAGWTLGFRDTRQPYNNSNPMDTIAKGNTLVTLFSASLDTTYQQKLRFTLTTPPSLTQADSAIIYLSIHPKTNNPADSANYRFVMAVTPSASVSAIPEDRAGIAVTNAWPNPLVSEGTLHLEILTDATGPTKAILYDVTGTQKATLDLGQLHAGTNEIQLAMPTLPSGEYLIRIIQGGSMSEVVKINFVK